MSWVCSGCANYPEQWLESFRNTCHTKHGNTNWHQNGWFSIEEIKGKQEQKSMAQISEICLLKIGRCEIVTTTPRNYDRKGCLYLERLYLIKLLKPLYIKLGIESPQNRTRQHSTQSVGNMPPPSPRHLLPHVLQIMPRNPKYDQFQPKGHHNEENPQSTTKMPGNFKFYPFH